MKVLFSTLIMSLCWGFSPVAVSFASTAPTESFFDMEALAQVAQAEMTQESTQPMDDMRPSMTQTVDDLVSDIEPVYDVLVQAGWSLCEGKSLSDIKYALYNASQLLQGGPTRGITPEPAFQEENWGIEEKIYWENIKSLAHNYENNRELIKDLENKIQLLQMERAATFYQELFYFSEPSCGVQSLETMASLWQQYARYVDLLRQSLQQELSVDEAVFTKKGEALLRDVERAYCTYGALLEAQALLMRVLHIAQQQGWQSYVRRSFREAILTSPDALTFAHNALIQKKEELYAYSQNSEYLHNF